MGRSGLGSEPTLFPWTFLYSLSYVNLGVGPKGQDVTTMELRLESGKLRAVLFLDRLVCFCLSKDQILAKSGQVWRVGWMGLF